MIRVCHDGIPHLDAAQRSEAHELLHEALIDSEGPDAGRVLRWLREVAS